MKQDEILSRKDLAQYLKLSERTIRNLEKKGVLVPMRIGSRIRYRASKIDELLKSFEI